MDRPKRYNLGAFRYKIIWADKLKDDCLGLFSSEAKNIQIKQTMSPQSIQEVLMHELIHCTLDGLRLGEKVEEQIADIAGARILELFRNNHKLRQYLFEYSEPEIEERENASE